jgi:dTDP-4-amino-4,6-dideoxygalactose transaminase
VTNDPDAGGLIRVPHSRPTLDATEANSAAQAVISGYVGSGRQVSAFEQALAGWAQRRYALATNSGSAALHLVLLGMGIGPGDEVLLPALACRAVLNAVLAAGAAPRLVDIDPADLNMSAAAAEQQLSDHTRLVVLPHMFGASAELGRFLQIGVPVLEDAASSLGGSYQGYHLGHYGIASVYSFASTKMITAGQGGMLLTDSAELVERSRAFMDYDGAMPAQGTGRTVRPGFNYQLTDVPACIGLAQFAKLPVFLVRRQMIAQQYQAALADLPGVELPAAVGHGEHAFYRFILKVRGPAAPIVERLQALGIDARTSVAHWLYDYLAIGAEAFPGCESVRHRLVSLPIYPGLTSLEVEAVINACRQVVSEEQRL